MFQAVRRLKERNYLSQAEAEQRISSQLTPAERFKHSHVIFCSLWDYSTTQAQVYTGKTKSQKIEAALKHSYAVVRSFLPLNSCWGQLATYKWWVYSLPWHTYVHMYSAR